MRFSELPRFDRRTGARRPPEPLSISPVGVLTERQWFGDDEIIVRHDDIPDCDRAVVQGIPCTTALRTVIDLAPEVEADQLRRMVEDCLARELFTLDEAWARLRAPDMADRSGAEILRRYLDDR